MGAWRLTGCLLIGLAAVGFAVSSAEPSDPLATVDAYLAAWNGHDAAKAASFFADDGVYLDTTVGTPQRGREAVRTNVVEVFMRASPDLVWRRDARPPIVGPEGVAFEWTFQGVNSGPWDEKTPATGKPFKFTGVTFLRMKGGKIVYQGDYYDALAFQKQLGWLK